MSRFQGLPRCILKDLSFFAPNRYQRFVGGLNCFVKMTLVLQDLELTNSDINTLVVQLFYGPSYGEEFQYFTHEFGIFMAVSKISWKYEFLTKIDDLRTFCNKSFVKLTKKYATNGQTLSPERLLFDATDYLFMLVLSSFWSAFLPPNTLLISVRAEKTEILNTYLYYYSAKPFLQCGHSLEIRRHISKKTNTWSPTSS